MICDEAGKAHKWQKMSSLLGVKRMSDYPFC